MWEEGSCRPADSSVLATASNNCVAVRRDVNLSDARKRLKVAFQVLSLFSHLSSPRFPRTNCPSLNAAFSR